MKRVTLQTLGLQIILNNLAAISTFVDFYQLQYKDNIYTVVFKTDNMGVEQIQHTFKDFSLIDIIEL